MLCGKYIGKIASMGAIEATVLDEIPAPYSHLVNLVTKGTEKSWTTRWMSELNEDGTPMY